MIQNSKSCTDKGVSVDVFVMCKDFSLGGKNVCVGDIIGFDDGVIPGKQTEKEEWVVKFGRWDCDCGDYYCTQQAHERM